MPPPNVGGVRGWLITRATVDFYAPPPNSSALRFSKGRIVREPSCATIA
jgi:hypothetical protein